MFSLSLKKDIAKYYVWTLLYKRMHSPQNKNITNVKQIPTIRTSFHKKNIKEIKYDHFYKNQWAKGFGIDILCRNSSDFRTGPIAETAPPTGSALSGKIGGSFAPEKKIGEKNPSDKFAFEKGTFVCFAHRSVVNLSDCQSTASLFVTFFVMLIFVFFNTIFFPPPSLIIFSY